MTPTRFRCLAFFLLLLLLPCTASASSDDFKNNCGLDASSLDSAIRDRAFEALVRRRTGVVYQVPLPANLSAIDASVMRLRSRSFWSLGANISSFRIAPGSTVPLPHVRRLAIVYQNLGDCSASLYTVPGHSLVTSVVGLLAYNASDDQGHGTSEELGFSVGARPISVVFPEVPYAREVVKCAKFGPGGFSHFNAMESPNVCLARNTGHFAIVVPSDVVIAPPPPGAAPPRQGKKQMRWRFWVVVCGGGAAGLAVAALVGLGVAKLVKRRRMEEMRRRAEDGEALETVWVGRSRMPSASMVRTQPVLENGSAP